MKKKEPGKTRDVGYQVGARRTLAIDGRKAWRFLTSPEGVRTWLGEGSNIVFEKGAAYRTADGSEGEVRVFHPGSHVRITWRPPGWKQASTIQLRVIPNGPRTVIAFHQENLPGSRERLARRSHFVRVLDHLEARFAPPGTE